MCWLTPFGGEPVTRGDDAKATAAPEHVAQRVCCRIGVCVRGEELVDAVSQLLETFKSAQATGCLDRWIAHQTARGAPRHRSIASVITEGSAPQRSVHFRCGLLAAQELWGGGVDERFVVAFERQRTSEHMFTETGVAEARIRNLFEAPRVAACLGGQLDKPIAREGRSRGRGLRFHEVEQQVAFAVA